MPAIKMLSLRALTLPLCAWTGLACGSGTTDGAAGAGRFDGPFLDYPGAERANFGLAAPDGSAYFAAGAYKAEAGHYEELFVLKLSAAFEVERAFADEGVYRRSFAAEAEIAAEVKAAALDDGGRLYLCASLNAINGARDQVLVVRLDQAGAQDPQFGADGELRLDDRACKDLVVTSGGEVLVLAESSGGTEVGFHYLYAFDADGALRDDFGDAGHVTLNIDADKLLVTDDAIYPLGAHRDAIAFPRYSHAGRLDASFGNQDSLSPWRYMATATPIQDATEVRAFIVDEDGVVRIGAHTAPSTSGFHRDWGIVRFQEINDSYVSDEFLDYRFTATRNVLHDLVRWRDGGYLAAGQSYEDNHKSAYVLALTSDGQVDHELGHEGGFELSFSGTTSHSEIVALWPDGDAYRLLGNVQTLGSNLGDPSRIVLQRFDPLALP